MRNANVTTLACLLRYLHPLIFHVFVIQWSALTGSCAPSKYTITGCLGSFFWDKLPNEWLNSCVTKVQFYIFWKLNLRGLQLTNASSTFAYARQLTYVRRNKSDCMSVTVHQDIFPVMGSFILSSLNQSHQSHFFSLYLVYAKRKPFLL